MVYLYRDVMTELLDRHCPVVKVRHKAKPMTPWFDAECRAVRRRARAAERRFRRRRSDVDRSSCVASLKTMRSVYENKRDEFWRKQIAENKGNTKRLWRTLDGLLDEASSDDTGVHTADDFAAFFKEKIAAVRASTATTPLYEVLYRATASTLGGWTAVTANEV